MGAASVKVLGGGGGGAMEQQGVVRQSNRYNATYITLHLRLNHGKAGRLATGWCPHWHACCVCNIAVAVLYTEVFVSGHCTS